MLLARLEGDELTDDTGSEASWLFEEALEDQLISLPERRNCMDWTRQQCWLLLCFVGYFCTLWGQIPNGQIPRQRILQPINADWSFKPVATCDVISPRSSGSL